MTKYGSDVVVDLLQQAGIEHIAINPGASLRGIQDSLVHTEGAPDLVLCLHEAVAVGAAQGYAKATGGGPMGVMLHDVVGLQNASMAIYNAWCDRAAMLLIGGTGPKSKANRRPWIDWIHTASVQANIIRDFVKWDDEPHDIESVPESFARAWATLRSAPSGPVYMCYDAALQEDPLDGSVPELDLASFSVPTPPAPRPDDVRWMREQLNAAERPVIIAGYTGESDQAFTELVELAEALGAPVVDTCVRHAFPTSHALSGNALPDLAAEADVVLALDVDDLQALGLNSSTKVLHAGLGHMRLRSWSQDYQALVPSDRLVTSTAEEAVRALLALVREDPIAGNATAERSVVLSKRISERRADIRDAAAHAFSDGRVPVPRLISEVGAALRGQRFVLANRTNSRVEQQLLDLDQPRQALGWLSGGGLGYGVSASIGASVALGPDTIVVDIQADGDFLFLPNALWTAVQRKLPILVVVCNNRQYGNTVEHAAKIARARGRDDSRRYVGSGLAEPAVDLAGLAASFGAWSAGPITDPDTLATELVNALEAVRAGRPALLDVLTPGF